MDTRHEHDTPSHTTSPLRAPSRGVLILTPEEAPLSSEFFLLFAFRWSSDGRGARPPLLAFFSRGPATVSSSLSDSVAITDGDPMPDSLGGGRRHWVATPPLPGKWGQLSSVEDSRPPPRSLYRPRLVGTSYLES